MASPFVFIGGDIALDFVNTLVVDSGGEPVDLASTPAELAAWVAASDLGRAHGAPDPIAPTVHATALALRGALKVCFDALTADEPIPDEALSSLNAVLRTAPGTELCRLDDGVRLRPAVDLAVDATALPWLLADAGARLLVGDHAGSLRRCANHDTCVLMFLDTSRSHTRRWCSMDLCGNRSKVAAHGVRTRRQQRS